MLSLQLYIIRGERVFSLVNDLLLFDSTAHDAGARNSINVSSITRGAFHRNDDTISSTWCLPVVLHSPKWSFSIKTKKKKKNQHTMLEKAAFFQKYVYFLLQHLHSQINVHQHRSHTSLHFTHLGTIYSIYKKGTAKLTSSAQLWDCVDWVCLWMFQLASNLDTF